MRTTADEQQEKKGNSEESQKEFKRNQKANRTHVIPGSLKESKISPQQLRIKNKVSKQTCAEDEDNWRCTNEKLKAIPTKTKVLRRQCKIKDANGQKKCNSCKADIDACTEKTKHTKEYDETPAIDTILKEYNKKELTKQNV